MAFTPNNLADNQKKFIIDFYNAQPNGLLDPQIKSDLKEFKKYKQHIDANELQLSTEIHAKNALVFDIDERINRLNKKIKNQKNGISLFEENIIDRHFELNGDIPPLDAP